MKIELIGVSENIRKIRKLIRKIAKYELKTLVYGETGVGKELIVQSLHQKSKRAWRRLVKVNCAALPETLLESEIFGYERGAFTGAQRKMQGKFEQAHNGVLFLDEIGEISIRLQSKLLQALQDGSFIPLGSEKMVQTDVWVIAATSRNLVEEIKEGRFREDLFFRLSIATIEIFPLRKRPEDIPHLIEYYFTKYAHLNSKKGPKALSPRIVDKLVAYHWPGNVRELQNVLRRLIIHGVNNENIDQMLTGRSNYSSGSQPSALAILNLHDFLSKTEAQLQESSDFSLKKIKKQVKNQIEKEVIKYALEKTGWNRSAASRLLNISYRALLYKIQELNIDPPELFQ